MIQDKLKTLPSDPGVYLMKDITDQIIYVGKAKNLKNRVRQYFSSYGQKDKKVKAMVSHIAHFEYIIVQNELESLILESNLIKEYHPKYNILLRDDKQYPYIKISLGESYPRVMKTRNVIKDKSKYFGPFPNAMAVNEAIQIFHEIYPIRNCKLDLDKNKGCIRPCLNYFIHRCVGPCLGNVDVEEYGKYIDEILNFLEGKDNKIIDKLELKMLELSKNLSFEEAATFRDKIIALKSLTEKQLITEAASSEDYDVVNYARGEGKVCIQIFFYRQGKALGREHFILEDPYFEKEETILQAFITQFYQGSALTPSKIYLPVLPKEVELIEKMLEKNKGKKISFVTPQRGEKRRLLSLVKTNAIDMLVKQSSDLMDKKNKQLHTLGILKETLSLKELPSRIEAYDISNISGAESVGSMVVFEEGRAKKSDYRRFRIKSVVGPNDYASMKEVISRRFLRGISEKEEGNKITSFSMFPDLIIIDGGKGQVNIAKEVLEEFGIEIPIAGLVKDDYHKTRGILYENKELSLDEKTPLYKLLFQIQEEAHRFAINYHRSLRSKSVFSSQLDGIKNIGSKRKKALMSHFKSIEKIKKASIDELLLVDEMNRKAAESVYEHFRGGSNGK